MTVTRRDILIFAAAASLAAATPAMAQEGTTKDQGKLAAVALPDHVLGSATAPVTVIEYASPTCPHCATFHNTVYPQFKADYIDTGKVRFILRPFVRNVQDAVVFMLAVAAGDARYHDVVSAYFKTQQAWGTSNTPRDAILDVAKQLGFTEQSFDAALTNQDLFNAMEKMRNQALEEFNLEGTPTFYVNGKQLTGDKTLDQLKAEIDPLVPASFQPTTPAADAPVTPAVEPTTTTTAPATDAPVTPPVEPTTTTAPAQ